MEINETSYEWHRGKKPNGIDSYAFEVHLNSKRCFEILIHGDYKEALKQITDKYRNSITKILVGI